MSQISSVSSSAALAAYQASQANQTTQANQAKTTHPAQSTPTQQTKADSVYLSSAVGDVDHDGDSH
ncbi:MAG TPA: hypothetical protein VKG25_18325 [Bryobacteraceae bacterium]|nr:hypothetical protein [Bryobacteraceae bacterium]